jgi:hypothetical protein
VDDCPRPAVRRTPWGNLCETHRKRKSPARGGENASLSEAVQARITDPLEALRHAAMEYANADSEDDASFTEAEKQLRHAAVKKALSKLTKAADAYASVGRSEYIRERIRDGMAAVAAAGVKLGRPAKLDGAAARHAIKEHGSIKAAAFALGLNYELVRRAAKRFNEKMSHFEHGNMHALSSPLAKKDSEQS